MLNGVTAIDLIECGFIDYTTMVQRLKADFPHQVVVVATIDFYMTEKTLSPRVDRAVEWCEEQFGDSAIEKSVTQVVGTDTRVYIRFNTSARWARRNGTFHFVDPIDAAAFKISCG